MVHKVGGSITVFLSFVLVLVLALIGTLLDVARIGMADSFSYRALASAVDAEFTNYCSELYEDYHIYMLGNGHDISDMDGEEIANSISEYLMCTFDPNTDLGSMGKLDSTDLLSLTMKNCKIEGMTALTDYDAKIFQDQVAQYMKYAVAGNAVEGLLEKLKLTKQSGETMEVVRKKNEAQEAVSKVDAAVMSLMEEVEGITFKNNALVVKDDYTVKTQESFAKQFYTGSLGSVASTIRHNVIWDSLKDKYRNPVKELTKIKEAMQEYQESTISMEEDAKAIKELEEQIASMEKAKEEREAKRLLQPVSSEEEMLRQEEETKKEEEKLKELKEKRKEKENAQKENKRKLAPLLKRIRKSSTELGAQADKVHKHTVNAIQCVKEVQKAKDQSIPMVRGFEDTLAQYRGRIPEDTYHGLEEEYSSTKDYIENFDEEGNDKSMVGNILKMSETLEKNKKILESTSRVTRAGATISEQDFEAYEKEIDGLLAEYEGYSIKELRFDYSTLQIEEKVDSPMSSFGDLIKTGLLGLIVDDPNSLSKASLSTSSLATSAGASSNVSGDEEEEKNGQFAQKISESNVKEGIGISENLKEYEEQCKNITLHSGNANPFLRKLLVNEYGVTNFKNISSGKKPAEQSEKQPEKKPSGVSLKKENKEEKKEESQENVTEKETKLQYEQEYLVIGAKNDLDNVKSVIVRTLFMRTAVNYLSLLTDAKCRAKAKATATALVGFTGFAPLIAVMQQVILIVWAFEEGFVECRVLLDGGEVPFMKRANEFQVKFEELFTINKQIIQKKAKAYGQGKKGITSVSYGDYVRIYLLMVPQDTLSYRMMDLIQANLQLRYDPQFSMAHGIFGAKVSMDVSMPGKFLNIPFVKAFAGYDGADVTFHVSTEYSY